MRMKLHKVWLVVAVLMLTFMGRAQAAPVQPVSGLDLDAFRHLAIQEGGRVKPIDTFARESVLLVTGKTEFEGFDPVELTLSWITKADEWKAYPCIEIRNDELKKELGLDAKARWFKLKDLADNKALDEWRRKVGEKAQRDEKLNDFETNVSALINKMTTFVGIVSGYSYTIVPLRTDPTGRWISMGDLASGEGDLMGYAPEDLEPVKAAFHKTLIAYNEGQPQLFNEAVASLRTELAKLPQAPGIVPSDKLLAIEVQYNKLHPFRKAWIIFACALVALLLSVGANNTMLYRLGMVVYVAGIAMSVYGYYLRCTIAGRPPVTNMYESVLWVAFGAAFFALIFELLQKARKFAIAGAAVAVLGLVLADNLPNVLDASISPLAPVLRSNYWLTIHVLTITASYAAFFLAWGLGHMALFNYLRNPANVATIRPLNKFVYQSIQVGVLLLAAGTILGGVWANYSWGRFWGWDPKEVWALIALLCYLAVLHGRYAGWVQEFGMSASAVICFLSVIMAWYGVNFVLGVGLHSYGFGTGGSGYVLAVAALDIAFVVAAHFRYLSWKNEGKPGLKDPTEM